MKLIIFITLIILFIVLIKNFTFENFTDNNLSQITFTQLNDVLIKSYNINLNYSLNDNELISLFIDNIIKINIPVNYIVVLKYNYPINPIIIQLPSGTHHIYKSINNYIINEIEIKNIVTYTNQIIDFNNLNTPIYWNYYPYLSNYYGIRSNNNYNYYNPNRHYHNYNYYNPNRHYHNYNNPGSHNNNNNHDSHNNPGRNNHDSHRNNNPGRNYNKARSR